MQLTHINFVFTKYYNQNELFVKYLGNFSIILIQKKIKNKYVPSYILIIIILITEIIARVATAYPAAPEPTLVDIAAVDVVVPLDVVQ